MSAQEFQEDGIETAYDFEAYSGWVTIAGYQGLAYVQVEKRGGTAACVTLRSSELLNMAHWIIRNFTED